MRQIYVLYVLIWVFSTPHMIAAFYYALNLNYYQDQVPSLNPLLDSHACPALRATTISVG